MAVLNGHLQNAFKRLKLNRTAEVQINVFTVLVPGSGRILDEKKKETHVSSFLQRTPEQRVKETVILIL